MKCFAICFLLLSLIASQSVLAALRHASEASFDLNLEQELEDVEKALEEKYGDSGLGESWHDSSPGNDLEDECSCFFLPFCPGFNSCKDICGEKYSLCHACTFTTGDGRYFCECNAFCPHLVAGEEEYDEWNDEDSGEEIDEWTGKDWN
mmetsp:Transcript_1684/g.2297  ORF Transcript_1684/g.2297 Transcript_1684/m.2297 type:complete len:149 (-) Transcript_1684:16-462(-)